MRLALVPAAEAYASSMPFRSMGTPPALTISTNSSEALAPPVTTSASSNAVEGGQPTTAAGSSGPTVGGGSGGATGAETPIDISTIPTDTSSIPTGRARNIATSPAGSSVVATL